MAGRGRGLAITATLGGVGAVYYLYTAGGNPKVAEKNMEKDAHKVISSVKGESVSPDAAKKQGEAYARQAGAAIDRNVEEARRKLDEGDRLLAQKAREAQAKGSQLKSDAEAKFDQVRQETSKDFKNTVDNFDKTVEKKTSEAKSGISSWFGFGK